MGELIVVSTTFHARVPIGRVRDSNGPMIVMKVVDQLPGAVEKGPANMAIVRADKLALPATVAAVRKATDSSDERPVLEVLAGADDSGLGATSLLERLG